jgi:hypothetical protein
MEEFKIYINTNTTKTENLNKMLYVYKFIVPRDDFRDVIYMIIDAIKSLQPNPNIYGEYNMPLYYSEHPDEYPEYKKKIIKYITNNLSKDNVMLPILEDFDYKQWSGRWTNIENFDTLMFDDITNKLGFDGYGRIYSGLWYFYRTEPMK